MIIQISSEQGPAKCELAVVKLYNSLKNELKDIELIQKHKAKTASCCSSIMFSTEDNLSDLEGTVQWICESPFRPHHKRKNWFVDVSIIKEAPQICKDQDIRFERFHCGGNGGQNVNKVETGVRTYPYSNWYHCHYNRRTKPVSECKNAIDKLNIILSNMEAASKAKQTNDAWREHNQIVRGNPVRVYKGKNFILKKIS